MSEATPLRFVTQPYHPNQVGNLLATFREQGFAVVPDVFERESVIAYRQAVYETVLANRVNGRPAMPEASPLSIAPTRAPRLRQILRRALSPSAMSPHPSLFEIAWLIKEASADKPSDDGGWHKDREHDAGLWREYHYPRDIHIAAYWEDMTPEMGPTQVLPRSHWDPTISPQAPGVVPASFLARAQDLVIWDQRCWHRATPRSVPGLRILTLFGFFPVPIYHGEPHHLKIAQREAWLNATNDEDRVLYGGTFAPPGHHGFKFA